jgi:general secretion pathway protein I
MVCRSAPSRPAQAGLRRFGFTLLEVMIALAILSVALVAIAGINSGALDMHSYAKRLTVASLLARSKMADLESELQAEGLPADDTEESGDFDKEGFPEYRWEAQIIRPKTEEINVTNLIAATGMGLEGLLGGADGSPTPASTTSGGMLAGAMQGQIQRMLDDLGKAMREVRLTVSWQQGKQTDQFTVVTHVISLGRGTDQAASTVMPQQAGQQLMQPPTLDRSLLPSGGFRR